ncbi:MAG: hypothetical protein AAF170_07600 [Bacteroidota bacterium]
MAYRLRFFFDPGSGVCFWSDSDEAYERFGDYPVLLEDLPLTPRTRADGNALIERFDTSLDWECPPDPSPWTKEEARSFRRDALAWFDRVREELDSDYDLVNTLRGSA